MINREKIELNVELIENAKQGNTEKIKSLLRRGADIDYYQKEKSGLRLTALLNAIGLHHTETARTLIEFKADVNFQTRGITALVFAAYAGSDPDLISELIDHGADINCRDLVLPHTVLSLAMMYERHKMIELIVKEFEAQKTYVGLGSEKQEGLGKLLYSFAPLPTKVLRLVGDYVRPASIMRFSENSKEYAKKIKKLRDVGDIFQEAQHRLGLCYLDGIGDKPEDHKKAVELFRLGVEANYAKAQNSLAYCYDFSKSVPESISEAMRLYRLASNQGLAKAHDNLALLYSVRYDKEGEENDRKEAACLYQLAASQGYMSALRELSRHYMQNNMQLFDEKPLVEKNENEAARLKGLIAEKEKKEATRLLLKVTMQRESFFSRTHRELGSYYEMGMVGFKKDINEARYHYYFSKQRPNSDGMDERNLNRVMKFDA